jgi:hypothetical protein
MGKQMRLLKNNPNSAEFRLDINLLSTIEKLLVIKTEMSAIRSRQAGQQIHKGRFTAS